MIGTTLLYGLIAVSLCDQITCIPKKKMQTIEDFLKPYEIITDSCEEPGTGIKYNCSSDQYCDQITNKCVSCEVECSPKKAMSDPRTAEFCGKQCDRYYHDLAIQYKVRGEIESECGEIESEQTSQNYLFWIGVCVGASVVVGCAIIGFFLKCFILPPVLEKIKQKARNRRDRDDKYQKCKYSSPPDCNPDGNQTTGDDAEVSIERETPKPQVDSQTKGKQRTDAEERDNTSGGDSSHYLMGPQSTATVSATTSFQPVTVTQASTDRNEEKQPFITNPTDEGASIIDTHATTKGRPSTNPSVLTCTEVSKHISSIVSNNTGRRVSST